MRGTRADAADESIASRTRTPSRARDRHGHTVSLTPAPSAPRIAATGSHRLVAPVATTPRRRRPLLLRRGSPKASRHQGAARAVGCEHRRSAWQHRPASTADRVASQASHNAAGVRAVGTASPSRRRPPPPCTRHTHAKETHAAARRPLLPPPLALEVAHLHPPTPAVASTAASRRGH